ncbi:hypothetical protein MKX01_006373 [Papaver californicum]|nr:hypothetical protein MKX01_006373 [Papaver californicum]
MFLQKIINGFFFVYFLFFSNQVTLLNGQKNLPIEFFPKFLINLVSKYAQENHDYLISEKSYFFVGLIQFEFLLQWPLYMTCLIYGVSTASSLLVSIFYIPFMVVAVICILNGLAIKSSSFTLTTSPPMARKKRV